MNDHELDELLKKSLRPQITGDEIRFIRETEGQKNMKKSTFIKPVVAAATCAALVLGMMVIPDMFSENDSLISGTETVISTDNSASEGSETSSVNPVETNTFTMKAVAASKTKKELKKDVSIAVSKGDGAIWSGNPDTYETSYVESFPISCEGKNIKKINYSVNNGAFQIFHKKGDGFIIDGEKCTGKKPEVGAIVPKSLAQVYADEPKSDKDEEKAYKEYKKKLSEYEEVYYKSFSVSPDFQESDDVVINLCDDLKLSKQTYEKKWAPDLVYDTESVQKMITGVLKDTELIGGDFGPSYDPTDEEKELLSKLSAEGENEIYNKVKITCTVTFKDGSTKTSDITIGAKVMTARQADDSGTVEKDMADKKSVYTVYRVR